MLSTSWMKKGTPWVALLTLASLSILLPWAESRGFQGIPGNYCRYRRPSECCDDRYDDCSVPIQGTYCYCDEFCLTGEDHIENDCCPDFFDVCMHPKNVSKQPALPLVYHSLYPNDSPNSYYIGCEMNGRNIPNGESITSNCNECRCVNGVFDCDDDDCMIEDKIISTINQSPRTYGWRATSYSEYWGRKARDGLLLKTGTFNPEDLSQEMYPIVLRPDVSKIPINFDARKKVEWAGRVGEVCDQGWCGASWAFSTLGVAQDRLSILARGHSRMELSAQNLLSCAELGQVGCQGGHIDRAWNYLRRNGIVREDCYKYESGKSGEVPKCLIRRNDMSQLTCDLKDIFKMEPAYRISSRQEDIQWEILNNGPVQAMMTVHRDLFMYKSGVYSFSGLTDKGQVEKVATHSVRIIGWGTSRMLGSQPTKYWLVANSWGTQWGERGYFRIKRGTNECGIESFIIAARARLANYVYGNRLHYRQ